MANSKFISQILNIIGLIFVLGGCQKTPELPASDLIGDALFSDRPVMTAKTQVYLLELSHAPLLETAEKNLLGTLEIKADDKAALKKEQDELEAKLQSLSSDIRVLYRYQYILNAVAVVAPSHVEVQLKSLPQVIKVSQRQMFSKPKALRALEHSPAVASHFSKTSVTHIEAQAAYAEGVMGKNIRVGVLDTGIDYTHKMLGGSGKVEDFKSIDPALAESTQFPNQKVVGGIDLVGSDFDVASLDPALRIPRPDANPIDEEGHGSHVAGSIAGLGDGVNSYDGVAPEALLYSIKVFGSGSTSDEVVIAGLEWAVDPNQDGQLNDKLDVVNLSLGGANGNPYELYNKAIRQLSFSGTVVVASAGNADNIPFIVGSPSTSDEALSVAANIDSSEHNWRFRTVAFYQGEEKIALAEALESSVSKPIVEAGDVKGELIFGGLAEKDFSDEEKSEIKGKVLLLDRGVVTFQQKMSRAEKAGALGVIVAQNRNEPPFTMGGDSKIEIPAIMISQEAGQLLKNAMEKGAVTVVFQSPDWIEKPEVISRITDFSSRGPRSSDLLIKPEITGPGQNIISAAMGEGTGAVKLSGTSMSGPHVAGVMALLKQKFPKLSSRQLKSVVMSSAVSVLDENKKPESVARQGAGEVRVSRALKVKVVTEPQALSLGLQQVDKQKRISRSLKVQSLWDDEVKFQVHLESSSSAVSMETQELVVKPQGESELKLNLTLRAASVAGLEEEVTGWVVLKSENHEQRIPFLTRLQKVSDLRLRTVELGAESRLELEGSQSRFEFENRSAHDGEAWLLNLLSFDERKPTGSSDLVSRDCDIKAVGYRLRDGELEVGVKFFNRITTWGLCEVSLLLDRDGDKKPEAELALTVTERIPGLSGQQMVTTLLDFPKARALRKAAEEESVAKPGEKIELNLKSAILSQGEGVASDMRSAAMLKISIADLKSVVGSEPRVQVVATANEAKNSQPDDYLKDEDHWETLSLNPQDQSWLGLKNLSLKGGQRQSLDLEKGSGAHKLLILTPQNSLDGRGQQDEQIEVYEPQFASSKSLSSL